MVGWAHRCCDVAGSEVRHMKKVLKEQFLKDQDTIREKALAEERALKNKPLKPIKFERPQEGKIDDKIGGIRTFHLSLIHISEPTRPY